MGIDNKRGGVSDKTPIFKTRKKTKIMNDLVELERIEKKGMELMLETLVQTELKVSDYYCITLRSNEISFQGNFNCEIVRDLIAKGYSQSISTMGYVELSNEIVKVTLT